MKESQEIPWKRIFVEATAIVASILLAFAIDAWWQNRTDRFVEAQYLQAMRADLLRSLELLDENEATQRRQVGYLESLLLTNGDTPYSDELWPNADYSKSRSPKSAGICQTEDERVGTRAERFPAIATDAY